MRSRGFNTSRIAHEGWYGARDVMYGAGMVPEGNAREEDPIRREKDRAGPGSFSTRSRALDASRIVNGGCIGLRM